MLVLCLRQFTVFILCGMPSAFVRPHVHVSLIIFLTVLSSSSFHTDSEATRMRGHLGAACGSSSHRRIELITANSKWEGECVVQHHPSSKQLEMPMHVSMARHQTPLHAYPSPRHFTTFTNISNGTARSHTCRQQIANAIASHMICIIK